jgi:hypothetical protein
MKSDLIDTEVIGIQWRLLIKVGFGGKWQLFNWSVNFVKEPCAVTRWDGFESAGNANSFKFLKSVWVEYLSREGLVFKIYVDGGKLLYTKHLPAHQHRDVERFYVPAKSSDGIAMNKSKIFRYIIESCSPCLPFKLYKDSSRSEVMIISADQRQGYAQLPFAEYQSIDI